MIAQDPAARPSPSDEETQYVLGDAESMEIIVNLGPLRAGRPLSVERRALTPSSRRLWDQGSVDGDVVVSAPNTLGECMQPYGLRQGGQARPLDSHSTLMGSMDTKQARPPFVSAVTATPAGSSHHTCPRGDCDLETGNDRRGRRRPGGRLRKQRSPSAISAPTPTRRPPTTGSSARTAPCGSALAPRPPPPPPLPLPHLHDNRRSSRDSRPRQVEQAPLVYGSSDRFK